jgi:hypothetical protein
MKNHLKEKVKISLKKSKKLYQKIGSFFLGEFKLVK